MKYLKSALRNSSLLRLLFIFVLVIGIFQTPNVLAQEDEYYQKDFEWRYGNYDYTWNLSIPKTLYEEYSDIPLIRRVKTGVAGYGFLTTTQDPYVHSLAEKLNESATNTGYDSFETISFILSFVQSLPYTSDNVTTNHDEYPRFPIETLVDDGGDCEDTSILFATLVLVLGYGAVYINPPDHLAVGVLGDEDISGTYFPYQNRRYYYCETTGTGWEIGDLPPEVGTTAKIYDIQTNQQYSVNNIIIKSPEPSEPPSTTADTNEPTSTPHASHEPTPSIPEIPTITALIIAVSVAGIMIFDKINKKHRKKWKYFQPKAKESD